MRVEIERLIDEFEDGKTTRRQIIARLGALLALAAGSPGRASASPPQSSTFKARSLNHVALNVTDVPRSRDFYVSHLGLTVRRDNGEHNCFLGCGEHFVALFHNTKPGLNHYCYTIPDYQPERAVNTLQAAGLHPRRQEDRVYFDDPDGITVQVAAGNHQP